jgi:hypothetical protein
MGLLAPILNTDPTVMGVSPEVPRGRRWSAGFSRRVLVEFWRESACSKPGEVGVAKISFLL